MKDLLIFFCLLLSLFPSMLSPNSFTDGAGPLFTLYVLNLAPSSPPLHLSALFFCLSCLLVPHTHDSWSVGLYMGYCSNKFIIKTNVEQHKIHALFSCLCFVFVYLGPQQPLTRWVGCLRAIKRISVRQQKEFCAKEHAFNPTACILC